MSESLLPCPFCNGTADLIKKSGIYGYTHDIYRIRCSRCGAEISKCNGYKNMADAVIAAWNHRVPVTDEYEVYG